MEQGRVEKDSIALLQRNADPVFVKVVLKLLDAICDEPFLELLRKGQEPGRTAFQGHIGVRDGALQRQKLARDLHGFGVSRAGFGRLEAQVVVAMADLWLSSGLDYVDLRGDLVGGAEPGFADPRKPWVGVVLDERLRVSLGVLLEGVPDARVVARRGEVVAFAAGRQRFGIDDGRKYRVDVVE